MKKISFLFSFIVTHFLFLFLGSISFASTTENPTIDEELALRVAVAHEAYPDDGKFPGHVTHPTNFLKGHNFTKDEERSTEDTSVFYNKEKKQVFVGYRGLSGQNTLMAAIGSFSQYERPDFDAALKSYFPLNFLVKPYSVIMAMSFLTTIFLSLNCIYPDFNWTPKFMHETIYSWYKLSSSFAVLSCIFGTLLLTNALPKVSYQNFDGDILNIRARTQETIKYYERLGYSCEIVGHSLGALRAKMISGILDIEATVFSCPGGAYELLLGFAHSHKELMEKGVPSHDNHSRRVKNYIVNGDSLASAKKEDGTQSYSIPQSYGHPHKILPLWTHIMHTLGRKSMEARFPNGTPPPSPETKPKQEISPESKNGWRRIFKWLSRESARKHDLPAAVE